MHIKNSQKNFGETYIGSHGRDVTEIIIISYLPTTPLGQYMTQGQFFKRSLTGLNSEYSFS